MPMKLNRYIISLPASRELDPLLANTLLSQLKTMNLEILSGDLEYGLLVRLNQKQLESVRDLTVGVLELDIHEPMQLL